MNIGESDAMANGAGEMFIAREVMFSCYVESCEAAGMKNRW